MNNVLFVVLAILANALVASTSYANEGGDIDPPEITIGERLFLETRFAQAWYAQEGKADPVMEKTVTTTGYLSGPFAGKTMNCRGCHMVDEHHENPKGGMKTYADFATRSPIPDRKDGNRTSGRNSMSLVNISIPRKNGEVFHFDGEFNSMEDLVRATLTGRNYGWQPHEGDIAIKHLARMIREDDGKGELASEFGGSYSKILSSTAKDIPAEFKLPATFRVDVAKASDKKIYDAVAALISAYVVDLAFAKDDNDQYTGSPYDRFLEANKLPRKAGKGESNSAYSSRLLQAVTKLKAPRFIASQDGKFESHKQEFVFGENELKGLKLFFAKGNKNNRGGNCISCHAAPDFSDFGFHNTGLTQMNYDQIHGANKFEQLDIPELNKRNKNYNDYLPATSKHPKANSRYRSIETKEKPGYTDLGLWNVFANPDMPAPQLKLKRIMCDQAEQQNINQCDNEALLPLTIATFKTPVLRDLGHSAPYMHTGQFDGLTDAVSFYVTTSALAKVKQLRNADPQLHHINITQADVKPLVAFIKALNEDYD